MTTTMNRWAIWLLCFSYLGATAPLRADVRDNDCSLLLHLTVDRQSPTAMAIRLADKALQLQRPADARKVLDDLVAQSPELPCAEVWLASLLLNRNQPTAARAALDRLGSGPGERFELSLASAQLALADGRWYDAMVLANHAVAADLPPRWSAAVQLRNREQAQYLAAVACSGRDDWPGTIAAIGSLNRNDSRFTPKLRLLAVSFFHTQQPDKALLAFRELRTRSPDKHEPAEVAIARLHEQASNHGQAEIWFQKATLLTEVRQRHAAQLAYARFLLWNNRASEALAVLVVDGQTKIPEADQGERGLLLALAARMEGRHREAQRQLLQLHRQHPESCLIANHLVLVLLESDVPADHDRALTLAARTAQRSPGMADNWAVLGWAKHRHGDREVAIEAFSHAFKTGKPSRDALIHLAVCQLERGRPEQAVAALAAEKIQQGPSFTQQERELLIQRLAVNSRR